ncbi:MAG TPA: efflux RND transporter periplasmic adaptor subunit [Syntrophorhabdaceae bacterium]|nr:efflux RND transporter periplasmic adaptor subunit [Syntrophorhabdaceae bacterium]
MRKKIVIALIIVIVIIGAIYFMRTKEHADQNSLSLSGNVEVTESNVGFKIPGRIIQMLVDEGSPVKQGDMIAKIDGSELASAVVQNRAAVQEASARLQVLKEGSRRQEIEQSRANLTAQEAEFKRAEEDYQRAENLYRNGAISKAQFDAAKSSYDVRRSAKKSAAEALSLVMEGPRQDDIRIAERRLDQAKAMLTAAETRFNDTAIYAPMSGVVLRKNVEIGETVNQGTPVFTIGDLSNPWIKVYVKEDMIGRVKLGQKSEISVDSYKGKTYEGVVSFISSEAEFTPKTVQTPEERVKLVFGVKIKIKNEKGELKPGMPADVKLILNP